MDLFSSVSLGALTLRNRIVLSPMTRRRATDEGVPTDLMIDYYVQRADFGLIVTEGVYPSFEGHGYANQPGIVTDQQIDGWSRVFSAIHATGGRAVMQLMHAGRTTHPEINGGHAVLGPSAIPTPGEAYTPSGRVPSVVPEVLSEDGIGRVAAELAQAAVNAVRAGADGVELHGANGYLLHQFNAANVNQRVDAYGGSPRNRARFTIEMVRAVAEAIGGDRTALRVSPRVNIQGIDEPDTDDTRDTYRAIADGLADVGLAYLSYLPDVGSAFAQELRARLGAPFIVNSGSEAITTREEALRMMQEDHGDAVVVGRLGLANPDLVKRWRDGHELNEPRPELFYVGGESGYVDYPVLED